MNIEPLSYADIYNRFLLPLIKELTGFDNPVKPEDTLNRFGLAEDNQIVAFKTAIVEVVLKYIESSNTDTSSTELFYAVVGLRDSMNEELFFNETTSLGGIAGQINGILTRHVGIKPFGEQSEDNFVQAEEANANVEEQIEDDEQTAESYERDIERDAALPGESPIKGDPY